MCVYIQSIMFHTKLYLFQGLFRMVVVLNYSQRQLRKLRPIYLIVHYKKNGIHKRWFSDCRRYITRSRSIHYGREEEDIENVGSVCFSYKYRSRGGIDDDVAYFSDGVVAPTGNTGNSNSKNSVGLTPLPQYYWKDESIFSYTIRQVCCVSKQFCDIIYNDPGIIVSFRCWKFVHPKIPEMKEDLVD